MVTINEEENEDIIYEDELENQYQDMIDASYEPFKIGNLSYPASQVFSQVFRQEFLSYLDMLLEDGQIEYIGGNKYRAIDR